MCALVCVRALGSQVNCKHYYATGIFRDSDGLSMSLAS